MNKQVTEEDLKVLEELRYKTKSAFELTKILALIAFASGEDIRHISKILHISRKTIKRYVAEWCKKKDSR